MSDIYFTSDTHFSHRNIIEYSNRPFSSVEEMDEELIENWNNRVKHNDTIYHLGDFGFAKESGLRSILSRLNGQKHYIWGNHDKELMRLLKREPHWFQSIQHYKEISVGDQKIILLHYAMRVWNKSHRGSWQLYGHSHGSLPDDPNARSIDVGVDAVGRWIGPHYDYSPISYDEVTQIMSDKNYVPVDHHVER